MKTPLYVVLLHYPVINRNQELVTTSVTNMDIHDISRTARSFGASGYFIVTPIEEQHAVVRRILDYWQSDRAKSDHPDRHEALSLVELLHSFDDVRSRIREVHGQEPEVVMPDARPLPNSISYRELREELESQPRTRPLVIVLGTGWGIADSFFPEVDRFLAPIYGPEGEGGYNHLSVRSAAATILDRLVGQ